MKQCRIQMYIQILQKSTLIMKRLFFILCHGQLLSQLVKNYRIVIDNDNLFSPFLY